MRNLQSWIYIILRSEYLYYHMRNLQNLCAPPIVGIFLLVFISLFPATLISQTFHSILLHICTCCLYDVTLHPQACQILPFKWRKDKRYLARWKGWIGPWTSCPSPQTDPNHGIQTLNRKESAKLKSKPERTSRILELLNGQKEEIEAELCIHEEACGSIQSEIDKLKLKFEESQQQAKQLKELWRIAFES